MGDVYNYYKNQIQRYVGYPCLKNRQNIFTAAKVGCQNQMPLCISTPYTLKYAAVFFNVCVI